MAEDGSESEDGQRDDTVDQRPSSPSSTPCIDSTILFGEAETLLIEHEGETYRLRRTRLGKLVLTK